MGKKKVILRRKSYSICLLDTSEAMNIDSSRQMNTTNERIRPDNYPYSSYEQISTDQKHLSSTNHGSNNYQFQKESNNTNNNRHSLNPITSDDSGNESSIHYNKKSNSHFVVVAIDFGTTFSGYAFAFTRDIDSILMMRKVDGNDPGSFYSFYFVLSYYLKMIL